MIEENKTPYEETTEQLQAELKKELKELKILIEELILTYSLPQPVIFALRELFQMVKRLS